MSLPPQETVVTLPQDHATDPTLVETFAVELDDEDGQVLLQPGQAKTRSVSLWVSDAVLLLLEHVQLFALIVSISLSWPWPLDWIQGTGVFFLLNLDFWELTKVSSVYKGQAHAFEDPRAVPFNYLGFAVAWLLAAVLFPVSVCFLYAAVSRISRIGPVYTLLLRTKIVRWFLLVAQAFSLPFGLVVARLLGCQDYPVPEGGERFQSTVLRDTECVSGTHIAILAPLLLTSAFYFIVLPCWMLYRIQKELITPSLCACHVGSSHEQFVLVKEAEFALGLDIAWAVHHHSLFSSFRRPWVWFRPLTFFAKAIILVLYGLLVYNVRNQTIAIFSFVGLWLTAVLLVPVYRLWSFNLVLVFSVFVNLCNLLMGMLIVLEVQSSLLVGENLFNALLILNVSWLLGAVLWTVYLLLRSSRAIGNRKRPLWPLLPKLDRSSSLHSEDTERFCAAILSARKVLEQCYSSTQFFAPVHELSRQIQVINAYCREAEFLQDPMHPSLWALLAEMIDLHTELAPCSIYGSLAKETLSQTAFELLDVVPKFRQRLDQREHYLILWTPLKRRILLKLIVVSTFLQLLAKVRARIEPKKDRRLSTLSFLQDNIEEDNDEFLTGVEMWVNARKGKPGVPRRLNTRRKMPRDTSTESTQSNEKFILNVERWEQARRLSMEQHPSGKRKTLNRTSNLSTGTIQGNELFIQDVDRWVGDRRSSLASHASRSSLRPPGISGGGSSTAIVGRMSVRFNLDTISETEGSLSSLSTNSNAFN